MRNLNYENCESVKGCAEMVFSGVDKKFNKIKKVMIKANCGGPKMAMDQAQYANVIALCKMERLVSQEMSGEDICKIIDNILDSWDDIEDEAEPEPQCVTASITPEDVARLSDRLLCWFRPVVGSFTAGHSLCKIGAPNVNKDCIPWDQAEYFVSSLTGQAATWQHEQTKFIGSIVNACLDQDTGIVLANARFWEARPFTRPLVLKVKEAYKAGALKFSYEIYSFEVECSECHERFETVINGKQDHYCDHLKGRMLPGSPVYRIHRIFVVSGEGVVDVPAYSDSQTFIAAAEQDPKKSAEQIWEQLKRLNEKIENIIK